MKLKCFVLEEDILLGKEEIPCNVKCYDGYAIATTKNGSTLNLTYPKREDVIKDENLCKYVLDYRGLFDLTSNDIHYGDIMISLGEIKEELC